MIIYYLSHGLDINEFSNTGDFPLWSELGDAYIDIGSIRLLLKYGAKVDYGNPVGVTILHNVYLIEGESIEKKREVVKLLYQHALNPNPRDNFGKNPIHYYCMYDHRPVLDDELVKTYKLDINLPDDKGHSPLYLLLNYTREHLDKPHNQEKLENMLRWGADLDHLIFDSRISDSAFTIREFAKEYTNLQGL